MHMKKIGAAVAAGVLLVMTIGGTAASAEPQRSVTVTPGTVEAGKTFTVSGEGCENGNVVVNAVFISAGGPGIGGAAGELGAVRANAAGDWSLQASLPDAGTATINATCSAYYGAGAWEYASESLTITKAGGNGGNGNGGNNGGQAGEKLTVSKSVAAPGEAIVISGTGFQAGETVALALNAKAAPATGGSGSAAATVAKAAPAAGGTALGTVVAGADGSFTTTVKLPAGLSAGLYQIAATGQTSGRTQTFDIIVQGAAVPGAKNSNSPKGLAQTGAETSLALVGAAGAAAAIGAGLLVARRRAVVAAK